MTVPLEDELIAREAQWRASLLEITDYYESVLSRREAELALLQEQYNGMRDDRDAVREALDRYDRLFGRLRGTVVWRMARAVTRRRG
ncbi:hypothetical protein BH11ACT5_BH11ACT5_15150 [soil metagenome]